MITTGNVITLIVTGLMILFWLNMLLYGIWLDRCDKKLRKAVKAKDKDYGFYLNKTRYLFFECSMFNWFTFIKKYNEWIRTI